MFEALQTTDVSLERRELGSGEDRYMNSFSNNRGMPYKFVASVATLPFADSPWPLTTTRTRLNWVARKIVGRSFTKDGEFNELLTFGYFKGQKINFHDDGEKGLGETVATLSLGNSATMSFRVKEKHYTGFSKTGIFDDTTPLPGTNQYEARKAACEALKTETFMKPGEKQARLKEIPKELGLSGNPKAGPVLIKMNLAHGDIVIMHGQQIQEYIEVCRRSCCPS